MASGSAPDVVRIPRSFGGHAGEVLAVALTPDGEEIVTGGTDATVRVWNRRTGEQRTSLTGHTGLSIPKIVDLGMAFFAEQVGDLAPGPAGGPVLSPQLVLLRREGKFWAIGQDGERLRLRDGKGPRYLARLLADPGREFHALDLVTGGSGPGMSSRPDRELVASAGGDAGAVLDERDKAAYKRRLDELREEVADATAASDLVRADRAQEEIDFLVAELSAAVGLGGRDRKAAWGAERARQSVTRAVRSSIERIAAADAALGAHLQPVRTGTYCCYQPDPGATIVWET